MSHVATVGLIVLCGAVLVAGLWRLRRGKLGTRRTPGVRLSVREPLPERGLLVPEGVAAGVTQVCPELVDRLRQSASPIAFEYRPVHERAIRQLPTVRVNASMQQALVQIIQAAGPHRQPTLYRAILPDGAQLAKAIGGGFRGFAKGAQGKITAGAVLVPVAVGGPPVWAVIAVGVTVMALEYVDEKRQQEFQRRVTDMLARMDSRTRLRRQARLQAIDLDLSGAIARLLDGQPVDGSWEHARLQATEELLYSRRELIDFRRRARSVIRDGRADFRRLSEALGGAMAPGDPFYVDLELARSAIALGQKTALTEAAASAFRDPLNAYPTLRRVLESRIDNVAATDRHVAAVGTQLARIELTTRHLLWHRGQERKMQELLRSELARPVPGDTGRPIQFLGLPSGELLQLDPKVELGAVEGPTATKARATTSSPSP